MHLFVSHHSIWDVLIVLWLQAFWRIRSTPGRGETQFHAALVFPISVAPSRLSATNDPPPKMPFEFLRLQKGLSGAVIVTCAPEHVTPTVQVLLSPSESNPPVGLNGFNKVNAMNMHSCLVMRFSCAMKQQRLDYRTTRWEVHKHTLRPLWL
jgi:hypothetical protein